MSTLEISSQIQRLSNIASTRTSHNSRLQELPTELRQHIYGYLIRDGDLAIMRVSRFTCEDTRSIIYHHATFRSRLGRSGNPWTPALSPDVANKIQRLEITAHLRVRMCDRPLGNRLRHQPHPEIMPLTHGLDDIALLGGKSTPRSFCCTTLILARETLGLSSPLPPEAWRRSDINRVLQGLTGFKRLLIRVRNAPSVDPPHPPDFREPIESVQNALEPSLGSAKILEEIDEEWKYTWLMLEFNPLPFEPDSGCQTIACAEHGVCNRQWQLSRRTRF